MSNTLVERIEATHQTDLFYNTACLKVTSGNDFVSVYNELLAFAKETIKEKGCIEFFAAPSNIEEKEIMLWEVWENEENMQNHMSEPHPQKILAKNLVELKWSGVNQPICQRNKNHVVNKQRGCGFSVYFLLNSDSVLFVEDLRVENELFV